MSMPIMVTGQFGEVYRAQMGKTTVALKIIKKYASERVMEQFEREMSIMAQVTHNNIVTLHGIIREGHNAHYSNILTKICSESQQVRFHQR